MKDLEFLHFPIKIDDLPNSWVVTSFKKIVSEIQTGFACGQHNSEGNGVPHLRPMNINRDGELDLIDCRFVDPEKNNLRVVSGDILFNNTNSPVLVGKTTLIESEDNLAFSNHMTRIRVPDDILANFVSKQLHFLFQQGYFQSQCKKHVNQASISRTFLNKSLPFVLAPSSEQKRISDQVETLQAKSKKAKQALETARPLLDKFRQSILASAFRGDLTADWRKKNPDIEPASDLLERIRIERRKKWEENELAKMRTKGKEPKNDKWKSKYKEPAPLDHSKLYDLPSGWIWARFEDVAHIASNLVDPLKHLSYPHVAPDNIEKYTGRLLEYKTIEEDGVKSAKNKFFAGQIVYSKIRPYLSKCIIANFDGLCSADMYPVDSYIDTVYLYRYILSNSFLFHIQKEAGNRVVLPKANQKQLNAVPVPVPPFSEQKQIAKKINKMFKKKEWLEKTVSQLIKKIQNLEQAVFEKAFCGNLVAQDPSDESATILLKRIKGNR